MTHRIVEFYKGSSRPDPPVYDKDGYDQKTGYNADGFNREGYNRKGHDAVTKNLNRSIIGIVSEYKIFIF
jgi:hypothetical protein